MPVGFAATKLKTLIGSAPLEAAIVLGSSLGTISDVVERAGSISYADLPGFPEPGVSGHGGEAIVGSLGGKTVLVLAGRVHAYETGRADAMRPVIECLADLQPRCVILTNAAGSLVEAVGPGSLMLITDHISLFGTNPLTGEPGDAGFVPMTNAYDRGFADLVRRAAHEESIPLAEGVYLWCTGPSFETPAEIRAARALGADAVGMSTVPETIVCRRYGLNVIGISLITNFAAGIGPGDPNHEETKRVGQQSAGDMARLLTRLMELL